MASVQNGHCIPHPLGVPVAFWDAEAAKVLHTLKNFSSIANGHHFTYAIHTHADIDKKTESMSSYSLCFCGELDRTRAGKGRDGHDVLPLKWPLATAVTK